MYWNRLQIYLDLCTGRVADWPQKWPIKSLIVQLLKSCPHLHTFEFFLVNRIFKKFQSGTPGTSITQPTPALCVPVCYLDAHHLWLPPGNEGTSTRDFTEPPSQQQQQQQSNFFAPSPQLFFKKMMMMIIVDLFPRDFTFKCGTGMKWGCWWPV